MTGMTGLEVILGLLLFAIAICVLYLCLGCEKPRPGGKR